MNFLSGCCKSILLLGLLLSIAQNSDGLCQPTVVRSVQLFENSTLHWMAPENSASCIVQKYIIFITNGTIRLMLETDQTSLNINSVQICETYLFEVSAISQANIVGVTASSYMKILPSADINKNVTIGQHTNTVAGGINFTWSVDSDVESCISSYHITYWDETEDFTDDYVYNKYYHLANPVPCMRYRFQVVALIGTPENEGPPALDVITAQPSVTSAPSLAKIAVGNSSASMTWNVDAWDKNRCPIVALRVITAPNTTVNFPIVDDPSRPPVTVNLTGLVPNTVYISRVAVVNSVGPSNPVTVPFQTTD